MINVLQMFILKKERKLSSLSAGEELCPASEQVKVHILWSGENCV